jgi:DNA integrity scanning protein DisA with diadenylate cyclase activity
MEFSTFDVIPKRKSITVFKVGKLWLFKCFFEDKEVFKALLDHYNKDLYRFEFKSIGARNNALKTLERNGFDYDLVENLQGYVVKLSKFAKYAQILKNSVATKETSTERLFLMKDLAAVEDALSLGAKIVEGDAAF